MKKIERPLNQGSRSPCMEIMNLVLVADECGKNDNVHKNGLYFFGGQNYIKLPISRNLSTLVFC